MTAIITKITSEEFYEGTSRRGKSNEESVAALALKLGEAIKFPCRWKHNAIQGSDKYYCNGVSIIRSIVRRRHPPIIVQGLVQGDLRARCQDGMVHVMRIEADHAN